MLYNKKAQGHLELKHLRIMFLATSRLNDLFQVIPFKSSLIAVMMERLNIYMSHRTSIKYSNYVKRYRNLHRRGNHFPLTVTNRA